MKDKFCIDCPDREACFLGASCDFSKRVRQLAEQYQNYVERGKVPQMTSTEKKNVTPKDVAEMAAEEKLVTPTVPQQSETPAEETVEVTEEKTEMTLEEGGKKSFKERLNALTKQLQKNQKAIAVLGSVAAVVAVAVVKAAKKKATEVVVLDEEPSDYEQELTDAKNESEQLAENA